MNKTIKQAFFLMITGLLLIGCKKEIMDHPAPVVTNPPSNPLALNGSVNIDDYVSFNAAHNVLVFDSYEDISSLETIMNELESNYPFDRGNANAIANMVQQITVNGYSTGNSNQGNQVPLSDFELLLENSHPLSNESLKSIIQLHAVVPLPDLFLKDILISNVPFSHDIALGIEAANINPQIKNQIIEADDNKLDVPNYAYQDFLNHFPGYRSLYSKLLTEEVNQLKNGIDPGTNGFGDDLVNLTFERLIYNEKHEIYIEGYLYRLYEDCKTIAFLNSVEEAYEDMETIAPNGDVTIPTLNEGPEGIALNVMNDHVPIGYIVYNPIEYDPIGGPDVDPNYGTAMQVYNLSDNCAISDFTYAPYAAEDFSLQFFDMTDIEGLDAGDIYQYWQFGDGTGSFDEAPIHSFPGYGTYFVSLTTFSQDCGCWHVHRIPITINWRTYSGRSPECPISSVWPRTLGEDLEDHEVTVTVTLGTPLNPDNYVTNYSYKFYTENPDDVLNPFPYLIHNHETTDPFYDYTLPDGAGEYWVLVTTLWQDGCITTFPAMPFTIVDPAGSPPGCCDKKVRERASDDNDPDLITTYAGNTYRMKINDLARGTIGTNSYRKIYGKQTLYRKKAGGGWKQQKAFHKIGIYGTYRIRLYYYGCLEPPFLVNRNYIACNDNASSYSRGLSGFDNWFGLDENSMNYLHTVYLGGYTSGPSCEHFGGTTLFDNYVVQLGACD